MNTVMERGSPLMRHTANGLLRHLRVDKVARSAPSLTLQLWHHISPQPINC
jgi:hypothetical protein